MLSNPFARHAGSIRPLRCTARWLSTVVPPSSVAKPFIPHNACMNKPAVTNIQKTGGEPSSSARHRERAGLYARVEAVQRQLQGNATNPAFYHAVAQILKLRERYIQDRSVFVRAEDMLPILRGLGASFEDVQKLHSTHDSLVSDPTLPFRTTANCRFCLDWDMKSVRRVEHQSFMLSHDEDFTRFDSGKIRTFDEIQADLGLNSAFLALLVFKAMMIRGVDIVKRANLNYNINKWVCTVFAIRTHTTPDLLGEPALEGVHCDGVDHTLVTFLGANNMTSNSAATFLHSMDEKTGIRPSESSPLKIVGHNRHSAFLDTLIIVDHELKHSLTPVYAEDKKAPATRDVLILFTRKPYLNTHPAASFDSLEPHATLDVDVPLLGRS